MRTGKFTIAILTIVLMLWAVPGWGADVAKIGVINFQRIFESSTAGKMVKTDLKKKYDEMQADLEKKRDEINNLKSKLDAESMVMSKEMREEKERELRIKFNDIKALTKRYENELKGIEKRMISRIRKEVLKLVEEIGKKDGYLLILEDLAVLYRPGSIDITDKVIQRYNAKFAEGGNKP
jgi:outer membrane protein